VLYSDISISVNNWIIKIYVPCKIILPLLPVLCVVVEALDGA
jgi:hypothetical protein